MSGRPQPASVASGQTEPTKVALINVMGTISPRLSLMDEISGGCSAEQVGKAFDAAVADGNVGTIVLNFDTCGGSVFGIEELGNKIFAARGKKRVIGVANHEAASAGYWLLSACEQVVVAPNGWVGSIGVLSIHYSTAGWEEKQGYKTTIIRTPAAKAEGAAGEALTAEAQAFRQKLVDDLYTKFVAAVARNRSVSAAAVKAGYGQGRMLLADEALSAGMVDRIATLEQVLGDLGVTASQAAGAGDAGPFSSQQLSSRAASPQGGEPAFSFEGNDMNKKIFGCWCGSACARSRRRPQMPPKRSIASLRSRASTRRPKKRSSSRPSRPTSRSTAPARRVPLPRPAQAKAGAEADGDRAEDITAAVRLSSLAADRQVELISELLAAKDTAGSPISVAAAVRRIQKEAAEKSKAQSAGADVITAGEAERDKFVAAARDACLSATFNGNNPKQDLRHGEPVVCRLEAGARQQRPGLADGPGPPVPDAGRRAAPTRC
jgi:signal peptide peptidase SppA